MFLGGEILSFEWCYDSVIGQANKNEFPTLFKIVMDYLPVQATSVPSERVFSSAKEMDTNKRNRISPVLMEALQLLKFSLKKERLNFIDGWSTLQAAMHEPPTSELLSTPSVPDPNNTVDNLLHTLMSYDFD